LRGKKKLLFKLYDCRASNSGDFYAVIIEDNRLKKSQFASLLIFYIRSRRTSSKFFLTQKSPRSLQKGIRSY